MGKVSKSLNTQFPIMEILNNIKTVKQKIILGFLLILIVSLSFGLGFLVSREYNTTPIIIEKYSD